MLRESKVYTSLHKVKTICGAPVEMTLPNGLLCVNLAILLKTPIVLVFFIALHALAAYSSKRDPLFLKIYTRFTRQRDRYDPWPHVPQKINKRPPGFSRENLC